MPATETIAQLMVKLGLDTKEVEKGAKQAEGVFDELGKKIAGALSVAALVQFGRASVDAFAESERAIAKVQTSLESMGRAGFYSLDELTQKASDLSRVSIFDDDDILSNVTGLLVQFGNIGRDTFDRVQQSVIDLASSMGGGEGSLKTAAEIVGRAMEDPTTASRQLRTANVMLLESQRDQISAFVESGQRAEAQAYILDLLNAKVAGQGEALAATTGGAMTRYNVAMGEMQESIGSVLAEAFIPMISRLSGLALKLSELDGPWRDFSVSVGLGGVAIVGLTAMFGPLGAVIGALMTVALVFATNWDTISWGMKIAWAEMVASVVEKAAQMVSAVATLAGMIPGLGGAWDVAAQIMIAKSNDARAAVHELYVAQYEDRQKTYAAAEAQRVLAEEAAAAAAELRRLQAEALAASLAMTGAATETTAAASVIVTGLQGVTVRGLDPLKTSALQVPTTLEEVTTQLETQTLPGMEQTFRASTSRMSGYLSEIGSALRDDIAGIMTSSIGPALDSIIPGFGKIRGFFDELPALSMAINDAIADLMGDLLSYLARVAAEMLGIKSTTEAINAGGAAAGAVGGGGGAAGGAAGAGAGIGGLVGVGATIGVLVAVGGDLLGIWSLTGGGPTAEEIAAIVAAGGMLGPGANGLPGGMTQGDLENAFGGFDWSYAQGGIGFGNQTINVNLDGRLIAQTVVENMPEVLDIYGVG